MPTAPATIDIDEIISKKQEEQKVGAVKKDIEELKHEPQIKTVKD